MTDAPVTNARRIGFTALALVVFWLLAWHVYWMGCDTYHEHGFYVIDMLTLYEILDHVDWRELPFMAISLALIPTLLIHVSFSHHRLLRMPARSTWLVGLLFGCASGFCYWLGTHDAQAAYEIHTVDKPYPKTALGFSNWHGAARLAHVVSWPWLLLPIILTTAFVIFAAWGRAVRDGGEE